MPATSDLGWELPLYHAGNDRGFRQIPGCGITIRKSCTRYLSAMPQVSTITGGALRFTGAVAIGIFLLLVIQSVLLAIGGGALRLSGIVFILGLALIFYMAIRLAVAGKSSQLDRVAGTTAAAVSAATLVALGVVAALVVGGVALLSLPLLVGGGAEAVSAVLKPIAATAYLAGVAALLCAGGLAYVAYRLWSPRRQA
jgi:hypothetical protein